MGIAPSEAVVRGSGAERARASGCRPREGLIAGPVPRSIATTRIMTTNVKSLLLLIAAAYGCAASDPIISWRCRNSNRTIDVPAPLPAVAHTALMAAGVLRGDPLYRYNERDWSWVALENWTFEGTFTLGADDPLLKADSLLTMVGADTVATVSINGIFAGNTDSAFITWELFVAKAVLNQGVNTISVAFTNARAAGMARARAYPYPVPASIYYHTWSEPGDTWVYNATCETGPCVGGLPFRNFVRKSPTDFGWDWGPSFMPTGITGSVTLRPSKSASEDGPQLRRLSIAQEHQRNGSVVLAVNAHLAPGWSATRLHASHVALRLELCRPDCASAHAAHATHAAHAAARAAVRYQTSLTFASVHARRSVVAESGAVELAEGAEEEEEAAPYLARLLVVAPTLWWPRGYGEQPLYELRASLVPCAAATPVPTTTPVPTAAAAAGDGRGSDAEEASACVPTTAPMSSLRQRVGLRTVELVEEPALPPAEGLPSGTSFYFRVNGVPIFAKGSNLIPLDVFAPRETRERARWLLSLAAAANMNMVRVWGGGRYLPDWFYDVADELGIMIWQVSVVNCL
jgi:beta-mannosidase